MVGHGGRPHGAAPTAYGSCAAAEARTIGRLVLEKLPLLLLAAGSSAITFVAQRASGAMASADVLPLADRLANVPIAYLAYLRKTVWPDDLAVFYPREVPAVWQVAAAAAVVLGVTVLVVWQGRRRPYLAVGWLWYLGMLVPAIGLVQVGAQSMADRYTYLPLVGIFVAAVWLARDLAAESRRAAVVFRVLAVAALVACVAASAWQVRFWQDSKTLFRRALAVTSRNWTAHDNLARALLNEGNVSEASDHLLKALQYNPGLASAHSNLGMVFLAYGRLDEAIAEYREAIRLNPADTALYDGNLGGALLLQGNSKEALECFREAARLRPGLNGIHNNLGMALRQLGRHDEAIAEFQESLRVDPPGSPARKNLDDLLKQLGRQGGAAPPPAPASGR